MCTIACFRGTKVSGLRKGLPSECLFFFERPIAYITMSDMDRWAPVYGYKPLEGGMGPLPGTEIVQGPKGPTILCENRSIAQQLDDMDPPRNKTYNGMRISIRSYGGLNAAPVVLPASAYDAPVPAYDAPVPAYDAPVPAYDAPVYGYDQPIFADGAMFADAAHYGMAPVAAAPVAYAPVAGAGYPYPAPFWG